MAKRANGVSEFSFDGHTMKWQFDFGSVEYAIGDEPAYAHAADEFAQSAVFNGIKQTLVDSMALKTGATDREKFDALTARRDQLLTREWRGPRVGGGVQLPLFDVLKHYYNGKKTDDKIREDLSKYDAAARRKMYYADRLKKSREHIERERAKTAGAGGDELVAELDAI